MRKYIICFTIFFIPLLGVFLINLSTLTSVKVVATVLGAAIPSLLAILVYAIFLRLSRRIP